MGLVIAGVLRRPWGGIDQVKTFDIATSKLVTGACIYMVVFIYMFWV